jgi:hypothetical protein
VGVRVLPRGASEERDSWTFGNVRPIALTDDGEQALLAAFGESGLLTLLVPSRGGPPVRLGSGRALGMSADGKWVLLEGGEAGAHGLSLVPTGPGVPVPLRLGNLLVQARLSESRQQRAFHVDSGAVGFVAAEPGRPARSFWIDPSKGPPRAITPGGVVRCQGCSRIAGSSASRTTGLSRSTRSTAPRRSPCTGGYLSTPSGPPTPRSKTPLPA